MNGGNGAYLRVKCVGSVNLVFHMQSPLGEVDLGVQVSDVCVVRRISFNLFSLHDTQKTKGHAV